MRKNFKKLCSLMLVTTMVASLALGCSKKEDKSETNTEAATQAAIRSGDEK